MRIYRWMFFRKIGDDFKDDITYRDGEEDKKVLLVNLLKLEEVG